MYAPTLSYHRTSLNAFASIGNTGGFNATPGWDPVSYILTLSGEMVVIILFIQITGLGTPNFRKMLEAVGLPSEN